MHNRVRMIAASFLVKDLLLDWRLGERWFLAKLVDGDPASNNGGWQWSASTGTDAQPYFRIFSPVAQGERFDPDGAYVRRFVPELRDVPADCIHQPWRMPDAAARTTRRASWITPSAASPRSRASRRPAVPLWHDDATIRVGISTCLLGQPVRWDGGHKREPFLTEVLAPYFEWVPVCPEVEIGMGIPREPVQLVRAEGDVRMLGSRSRRDWTEEMRVYAARRVRALDRLDAVRLRAEEGFAELRHGAREGAQCDGHAEARRPRRVRRGAAAARSRRCPSRRRAA